MTCLMSTNANLHDCLQDNRTVESLAICIPTFKRPEGLRRLLAGVCNQRFCKSVKPAIEVLIVDNDVQEEAALYVENMKTALSFPVHYVVEKRRGIPFARNRLVTLSSAFQWIAFIDDDEAPSPHWLDELLHVQKTYDATVVSGPVVPQFMTAPPHWAAHGRFYESHRMPTGTSLCTFFTNNLLIKRNLLDAFPEPFETRMTLTGGTDSLLAKKILTKDVRAVWADEAVVFEYLPASRLTIKWYFRRCYRVGSSSFYCEKYTGRNKLRLWALSRASHLAGVSILASLSTIWLGSHKAVRGAGYMCQAAGILAAACGNEFNEYGRPDYE